MAKISLKFHEEVLQEFPLDGATISIGRTDENDIIIKNLGVSRKHAQITKENDEYFIEDMGSRNGTILNDKVISSKTKLSDQDKISIGKHQLLFWRKEVLDPIALAASGNASHFYSPEETMRIGSMKNKKIELPGFKNPSQEKNADPSSSQAKTRLLTQKINAGVEIIKGGIKQSKVKFDRLLIVAGKGASADIRIKGEYEKDVVFIISTRNTGYFISPPKGIPLTVNGKSIQDYIKLEPGDIIQAGETSMKFFQN